MWRNRLVASAQVELNEEVREPAPLDRLGPRPGPWVEIATGTSSLWRDRAIRWAAIMAVIQLTVTRECRRQRS